MVEKGKTTAVVKVSGCDDEEQRLVRFWLNESVIDALCFNEESTFVGIIDKEVETLETANVRKSFDWTTGECFTGV